MYTPTRTEYDAMVRRVQAYMPGVQIGGFNGADFQELKKLDEQRMAAEKRAKEDQPRAEAATRLVATIQRSVKAYQAINEMQKALEQDRRLHELNGAAPAWFAPVEAPADLPSWKCSTVDEYDAANAQASMVATELETRTKMMQCYLGKWERSTPGLRSLSIIQALADRLERLEVAVAERPPFAS